MRTDLTTYVTSKRFLRAELAIVLATSLVASAAYAIVSLIAKLTQGPLSQATATLNTSRSPRPYLDLTYQLLGLATDLVPVALVILLLSLHVKNPWHAMGLDAKSPWRDAAWGVALAAAIGIPGLALYVGGRLLGITAQITPAALGDYWWSVPVLILAALKNGLLEEVIVVAYLADRFPKLGIPPIAAMVVSSVLRGSYHLYQGFGPFIGNVVMGVVFWWAYRRTGRVMPLVIAHTILDVVAFVGWALVGNKLPLP